MLVSHLGWTGNMNDNSEHKDALVLLCDVLMTAVDLLLCENAAGR